MTGTSERRIAELEFLCGDSTIVAISSLERENENGLFETTDMANHLHRTPIHLESSEIVPIENA